MQPQDGTEHQKSCLTGCITTKQVWCTVTYGSILRQGFTPREIIVKLGSVQTYYFKMEFIFITSSLKETEIYLFSDKKDAQSLIRVQAISCILALNTCDRVTQGSTLKSFILYCKNSGHFKFRTVYFRTLLCPKSFAGIVLLIEQFRPSSWFRWHVTGLLPLRAANDFSLRVFPKKPAYSLLSKQTIFCSFLSFCQLLGAQRTEYYTVYFKNGIGRFLIVLSQHI